ncbi:U3 small nucleolar ribonucleoprotein protein MPP10-like [Zingiber officinale]|uniref:U3 small nucleolar ribonucleoprotein protein MPP10-like n=1 Tax=Zingiber officinale TaxID=94328 RepID=UPI001C4D89B2|nr:U3 small nucleolar ribonucleoprotein protein MPP10-like [Zingiber officinale]
MEEPRKTNKKAKKAKVKKDKWGQPLLVPVDDAEQASEGEQFQWTVEEKAVVPEEGTESHEITKVVVSDNLIQVYDFFQGHFDDVERAPILPSKPPKETKEIDENKSKKGLAEIYEEEYAQKMSLAPALLSASDKLKIEATMLFKKISLKLDALSHFHFAPKPVIEDMSIQVNVAALAMEEVAPLVVSDAAMLAPEEIFHGKGNIKEEAELTKEERKRRRANQKRRFR